MTHIEKGFHGLSAVTEYPLNGETDDGKMVLRVTSAKRHGGMVSTHASVVYKKPDGCFSFMMYQDFSRTIASARIARVTEKTLAAHHEAALSQIPAVLSEVNTRYNLAA